MLDRTHTQTNSTSRIFFPADWWVPSFFPADSAMVKPEALRKGAAWDGSEDSVPGTAVGILGLSLGLSARVSLRHLGVDQKVLDRG